MIIIIVIVEIIKTIEVQMLHLSIVTAVQDESDFSGQSDLTSLNNILKTRLKPAPACVPLRADIMLIDGWTAS